MSSLPGVWGQYGGFLAFFLAGFVASEPWRWAGALVGRGIDPEGEAFAWVRAVSSAIVAGLVTRMLVFPSGALADVPLSLRVGALACGIGGYWALGRNLGLGVASGLAALFAGRLLLG